MDLSGQIKTPVGHISKKVLVYAVGGAAVLAAIYYVRQRNASSSSSSSTDTSATTDPATGYPVGSAEDTAALQAQQQAQSGYDAAAAAAYGAGGGGGGGGGISVPTTTGTGFSTNGAWAQAAEDYLVNNTGADATTVAAALGKYITGQTVTDAQHTIISQAIAFEGYPPVNGSTGYPPSIHVAASTPAPPPANEPVPKQPANLRILKQGRTDFSIGWNTSVGGAYQYHIYENGKQIGTVFGTFYGGSGRKPNTKYGPFTVKAANHKGQLSPASNSVTIHTTK